MAPVGQALAQAGAWPDGHPVGTQRALVGLAVLLEMRGMLKGQPVTQ